MSDLTEPAELNELTEDQCIEVLPMIKDWDPGLRLRFVHGMNQLSSCSVPEPDLAKLIGMVIICCEKHVPHVHIRLKPVAAEIARANDACEESIAAILSPALPGCLDVFVYASGQEVVFSMPLARHEFLFIGTRH